LRAVSLVRLAVIAALLTGATASPLRASSANLGPVDPVAMDQPRVAVEVRQPNPLKILGPESFNWFLLDTGAQGLMAVSLAVTEMNEQGYQVEGTFDEIGLGGVSTFDVSAAYDFDFAGSDGTRYTLPDARILSDEELFFGGFGGIVGTPAMVGRVTSLDMTAMFGGDEWWDFGVMGVGFSDAVPAGGPDRFTLRLDVVDFPPPEQSDPNAPLPTYGPLPFTPVRMHNGANRAGGMFIFDTGAQTSMISTQVAIDLGLDANGDGDIWDDAIGFTTFTGVSGEVQVPLVAIEKLIIPTAEGVDLVYTELELPVYDIHPDIPGIFGCELLTTGWIRAILETGEPGAFTDVHIDLRDPDNAVVVLDLNPDYDQLARTSAGPGDANEDGRVDLKDFVLLKQHWSLSPAAWGDADFTADGAVDLSDFVVLKNSFNADATVPEPSALVLLAVTATVTRKRR